MNDNCCKLTTRTIAKNLAAYIKSHDWVPEGMQAPRVFLDGIGGETKIGPSPAVVVIPKAASGLHKQMKPQFDIDVLLAIDATAYASNAIQSTKSENGVETYGAGDILDGLIPRIISTIKEANPGAILASVDVEYTLDGAPLQYATLTLAYGATRTF